MAMYGTGGFYDRKIDTLFPACSRRNLFTYAWADPIFGILADHTCPLPDRHGRADTGPHCKRIGQFSRLDCALSGPADQPDSCCLDLSIGSCRSISMAAAQPRPDRPRADAGGSRAELGSQHPSIGGVPGCLETIERGHFLDHQSWERVLEPASRCHGCDSAHAFLGGTLRKIGFDSATAGDHDDRGGTTCCRDSPG